MNPLFKIRLLLKNIDDNLNQISSYIDKYKNHYLTSFVALLIIFFSFYPHLQTLDVPLYEDELYHVTDDVANGKTSSIYPFDKEYKFLGHPPGYRVTLYLWFKIFPKTSYSVRVMAVLISFGSLFLIFLILKQRLSFLYSLAIVLSIHLVSAYSINVNSVTGNMHEVFLMFLSIYFTLKRKYFLTSFFFLYLTMSRETGLSFLAVFLVFIYFENISFREKFKLSLVSLLPGVLALVYFFFRNYTLFGTFSNHPYITDGLAHIPKGYGLFVFNEYKLNNLKEIIRGFNDKMLPYYFTVCLVTNLLIAIKYSVDIYRRKFHNNINLIPFLLVFISLIFLTFYALYGDHAARDLLICYILFWVNLGILISILFKNYGKLIFSIFVSIVFIRNGSFVQNEYFNLIVKKYVFHAKKIQEVVGREKICLPWPFSFAVDKIHGYFVYPIEFKHECKSTRYFALYNSVHSSINDKRKKIIKETKATKVYEYKFLDRWLELYKTEKEVDVSI